MSTYKVKMTSGGHDPAADVTRLSESELETMEKMTETVSIKVSPRMMKRMKQITGLQGQVSKERILYEFVKYMIRGFAQ
ncbi:MAG: hypothetical protein ACON43_00510 [Flavobacteriaceae bacterium]